MMKSEAESQLGMEDEGDGRPGEAEATRKRSCSGFLAVSCPRLKHKPLKGAGRMGNIVGKIMSLKTKSQFGREEGGDVTSEKETIERTGADQLQDAWIKAFKRRGKRHSKSRQDRRKNAIGLKFQPKNKFSLLKNNGRFGRWRKNRLDSKRQLSTTSALPAGLQYHTTSAMSTSALIPGGPDFASFRGLIDPRATSATARALQVTHLRRAVALWNRKLRRLAKKFGNSSELLQNNATFQRLNQVRDTLKDLLEKATQERMLDFTRM